MTITKTLLLTSTLFALLAFTGCGETKKPEETKAPAMKCEAGKCGSNMDEAKTPAK